MQGCHGSRELQCQLKRYEPCLPRRATKPPAGPGWIHEIKHDGCRILAEGAGDRVRPLTRNGNDFASRFPLAAAAVAALPHALALVASPLTNGGAISGPLGGSTAATARSSSG
jgi:ATP-dependent DNA ligase